MHLGAAKPQTGIDSASVPSSPALGGRAEWNWTHAMEDISGGNVGEVLVPRQGPCSQRSLKQAEIEAVLQLTNKFPFRDTGLI